MSTILTDGYMPQAALSIDELRSRRGDELGRSEWIPMNQWMITSFAALTGDRQAIHLDRDRARDAGYPTTIAHGFLTLSLIGGLGPRFIPPVVGAEVALNYGFDRARLVAPVSSGDRVHAIFRLRDVDVRAAGQTRLVIDTVVEIEGSERPAAVADWIVLFRGAATEELSPPRS